MANPTDKKYLIPSQKDELIQFVSDHSIVLFNRKASSAIKHNLWQLISLKLNSMGPNKSAEGWKRCFTTLKAATKAKLVAGLSLSDADDRIAQICNMTALDVSKGQLKNDTKARKRVAESQEDENENQNNDIANSQPKKRTNTTISVNQQSTIPETSVEESSAYATTAQKRRLVRVVADNYSALYGKISTNLGAHSLKEKIWKLLSLQLNSLGPHKDVQGWQNCFNYLKSRTKEKLTFIRQHKMRHVVSPSNTKLNDIEMEIGEMCDIDTLDGHSKVQELGLRNSTTVASRQSSTVVGFRPSASDLPSSGSPASAPNLTGRRNESVAVALINVSRSSNQEESEEDNQVDHVSSVRHCNQTGTHASDGSETEDLSMEALLSKAQMNEILFQRSFPEEVEEEFVTTELGGTSEVGGISEVGRTSEVGGTPEVNENTETIVEEDEQTLQRSADTMHDSQPQDEVDGLQEDVNVEIRHLQQQPQRRGVEINNSRYVQPRRRLNDGDDNNDGGPRRNKLSVPLGVMAAESLDLQRKQNSLLTELVQLFREFRDQQ